MLLAPGEVTAMRAVAESAMQATYTRTPVSDGTADTWNEAAQTPGTPLTARPATFRFEDRLRTDERGAVTVRTPVLAIPYDDPLAIGDRVTTIADQDGAALATGTFTVETIIPSGSPSLLKRAVLRGGEPS